MREEGHYTIKRVENLPKKGNFNLLYTKKADNFTIFYLYKRDGSVEEFPVSGITTGTSIVGGTDVTLTGTGTVGDPYVINSSPPVTVENVLTSTSTVNASSANTVKTLKDTLDTEILSINTEQSIQDVAIALNTAKVSASGSVIAHSDVTNAGSGSVITTTERSQIGELVTLSGVPSTSIDLGTFTGSTITDTSTIKVAIQELELAVESVVGVTNLAEGVVNGTTYEITSSTGTNAVIPAANATNSGVMPSTDKIKSNFITVTQAVDLDAMETDISEHQTVLGVPDGSTNMETYTGSIITDNSTQRVINQELETAIELLKPEYTIVLDTPTGVDDSAQINSAITSLPLVDGVPSGTIILSEGIWMINAAMNLGENNLITFKGQGAGTILQSVNGGTMIESHKTDFSSRVNENLVIKDLMFRSHATIPTTAVDIRVRHNSIIRNCIFRGQQLTAIYAEDINNIQITGNNIVNVDSGIVLQGADFDIEDIVISNNDISYTVNNAISIDGSTSVGINGAQKINISTNTIEECLGGAIKLKEVIASTLTANTISQSRDYLISAENCTNLQIVGNSLKETIGGVDAILFIGTSASNIISNNINDVANAVNFDASSSSNMALYNGRLGIIDSSEENFFIKQDGTGGVRPIEHTYGGQARFASRASSTGGGFTDIHYLFESQLTNRNMAVALNAPTGQDARLYFNRNRTRGWVFHYQTTEDFDLFYGADEVIRFKDDLDVRIYNNLEVDGNIQVNGNVECNILNSNTAYTVATLPPGNIGDRTYITDSNTSVIFGDPLTGGGTKIVPVFYDGTQWIYG